MKRKRPYGKEMQGIIDAWEATDKTGKEALVKQLQSKYPGLTYQVLKGWVALGVDDFPGAESPIPQPSPYLPKRPGPNVPLRLKTAEKPQTIAIFNDTHNPFQDEAALTLAENFLKDIQPDYLIYNGDMNDFYPISKFDKNPARVSKLQEDIDSTRDMFRRHRQACPNTVLKLLDGNHENRLEKFLWVNAPALSSLRCLELEKLFGLKEFDIERIPYERGIMVNEIFLIIHGNMASAHSSYTAKRMFEKHGGCGLCAHSHRLGSYYKRNRFGQWGWWEGACLCDLNPDYITNPDWQQGFNLIHFRGKRFWVEQILIVGNTLMYGGEIYEYPKKNGGT